MLYRNNWPVYQDFRSRFQVACSSYIRKAWSDAKRTRKMRVGPVNVIYRLARDTQVAKATHSIARGKTHQDEINLTAADAIENSTGIADSGNALLVGVGPGLGVALTKKLSDRGMSVSIINRNAHSLNDVISKVGCRAENIHFYPCDATDERDFRNSLDAVVSKSGIPDLVVYLAQGFNPGTVLNTEVATFEDNWRANCLGAFIVGKFCAELMARRNSGTIIFAGATSGTVGRAGYVNLAVGKFGLRALSQVMARELWPKGIHVAHVIIDADIAEVPHDPHLTCEDVAMNPMDAAGVFYDLFRQAKSAWSQEIDLRPWNERFWEHC